MVKLWVSFSASKRMAFHVLEAAPKIPMVWTDARMPDQRRKVFSGATLSQLVELGCLRSVKVVVSSEAFTSKGINGFWCGTPGHGRSEGKKKVSAGVTQGSKAARKVRAAGLSSNGKGVVSSRRH